MVCVSVDLFFCPHYNKFNSNSQQKYFIRHLSTNKTKTFAKSVNK